MEIPGIIHRSTLQAKGVSRRRRQSWLASGAMRSVPPWYITPEAPPDIVVLLEHGMRPTCLDAASLHGLWVPVHEGTHVFRPRSTSSRGDLEKVLAAPIRRRRGEPLADRDPQPLVLHRTELRSWVDDHPVPDLGIALEHAGRCLPTVKAAVLFESALHRRLPSRRDADRVIALLPQRFGRPLGRIRGDAESGTETMVRWWLEARRIPVRSQGLFPRDDRRMDLLVGRRWVIECDSREFHDDPDGYEQDRARDLHLVAHGYQVTRLSWKQVCVEWASTEAMLRAVLSRGEHLRPPRAGTGMLAA